MDLADPNCCFCHLGCLSRLPLGIQVLSFPKVFRFKSLNFLALVFSNQVFMILLEFDSLQLY